MEAIKELYKIGPGPSSSHTLAPWRAAQLFIEAHPNAMSFDVELYGSLALTGKGHFTDEILIKTFLPKMTRVFFKLGWEYKYDNGLIIKGYDERNTEIGRWTVFSLGGGSIKVLEQDFDFQRKVYPYASLMEIYDECEKLNINLVELVEHFEPDLRPYLERILDQMLKSVKSGLEVSGVLPGKLQVPRVAKSLYLQAKNTDHEGNQDRLKLVSYAYANNEENASGQLVVTAPTLGASGVMAALMYHLYHDQGISKHKLVSALMVGGIFGNLIKTNATISGAVGGCQAEIGSACSMAAAAYAYVLGENMDTIAYAAEIAMEHHLGLTCDPVGGYVIIPCIERNGAAVLRSVDAVLMASSLLKTKPSRVSFDQVVKTMQYTGQKMALELRESSLGGLAKVVEC